MRVELLMLLTLLLGLMRLKSSIVSSISAAVFDRRVKPIELLNPFDEDNEDDDEEGEKIVPFTLAKARGCILFLLLAPPRGMIVLST